MRQRLASRLTLRVIAIVAFATTLTGASYTPVWFFDDNRDVHVHGKALCLGLDIGAPYGIPKVEWLEIRGRSHVLSNPQIAASWGTTVPLGWTIEWFLKCSDRSAPYSGKFTVNKQWVGSSYDQVRNICSPGLIAFGPCTDPRIGGCVTLLLDGALTPWMNQPPLTTFEDVLVRLQAVYGPNDTGPNDIVQCVHALLSTFERQVPLPATAPPIPALDPVLPRDIPTLAPVRQAPPVPNTPGSSTAPAPAPTSSPRSTPDDPPSPPTSEPPASQPDPTSTPNDPPSTEPSEPPPPAPSISLQQGGAARYGYWYDITLNNFGANQSVSVTCRDSVDPGGFRTFNISTDGNGYAHTTRQCYSGDHPDHWVTANDQYESNRVSW
jgi:hypothetical protein